MIQKAHPKP